MQSFVEARMSEPIDPDGPLWRAYILEGNDFGALMIRLHHAIADGTALSRVLIEMTTEQPEGDYDLPEPEEDRIHPADQAGAEEPIASEEAGRRKRDRARQAGTQAATFPLAAGVKATSGAARLLEMLDLDREGSMASTVANQAVATADALDRILVGTPPKAPFTRGTFTTGVSRPVIDALLTNSIGVTTNVPGPQHPRYLAGQEMVGILGWGPRRSQAVGLRLHLQLQQRDPGRLQDRRQRDS
jgi:hypothetical protein